MARRGILSRLRLREQPINASTVRPKPEVEPEASPTPEAEPAAEPGVEGEPEAATETETPDEAPEKSDGPKSDDSAEPEDKVDDKPPTGSADRRTTRKQKRALRRSAVRDRRRRRAGAGSAGNTTPDADPGDASSTLAGNASATPATDAPGAPANGTKGSKATKGPKGSADSKEPENKKRRPTRGLLIAAGVVLAWGAAAGTLIATGALDSDSETPAAESPAPPVASPRPDPPDVEAVSDAAASLGFPGFATKNTTRVGSADPVTTAAGAALSTFPSTGGSEAPDAVALVDEDNWQAGIAAAVLMAEPIRAPLLVSAGGDLPSPSEDALAAMNPGGAPFTGGAAVFAIGDDAAAPGGFEATKISGTDPATVAAGVAQLRRKLTGEAPAHIVIATADDGAFAMPAAAWAARSGDPVLFATEDELPAPTRKFLARNENVPVYVLGPPTAISDGVVRQISRVSGQAPLRVGEEDPVANAIEFATYSDGTFGWNINDPGHGFVVARSDRPLDAGAAAPISASGTWGPLLLTDSADSLPGALRGYLLDLKPGYRTDPTRALYNHIWVIGDEEAIDVNQQAALDDLAELALIGEPPEPPEPPTPAPPRDRDQGAGDNGTPRDDGPPGDGAPNAP